MGGIICGIIGVIMGDIMRVIIGGIIGDIIGDIMGGIIGGIGIGIDGIDGIGKGNGIASGIGIIKQFIQPHSSMIERWYHCQRCRFKSYCGCILSSLWSKKKSTMG